MGIGIVPVVRGLDAHQVQVDVADGLTERYGFFGHGATLAEEPFATTAPTPYPRAV